VANHAIDEIDSAIRVADAAGRKEDVIALAQYREKLVTPNRDRVKVGYADTEKGNLARRADAIGMNPRELYEPTPADDMSATQRFFTAADKGSEDIVGGITQLAAHVLPGVDPSGIDAQIADRDKYYRQGGLADTASGQAGGVVGAMTAMGLPGGAGLKMAERFAPMLPGAILPAAAEGGAAGLLEGMSMPVADQNYWGGKAVQAGTGAVLGGGANAGVQSVLRGGTGVANIPRRAANAPNDMLAGAMHIYLGHNEILSPPQHRLQR